MKKIISLMLIVVLVFSMVACSSSQPSEEKTTLTEETTVAENEAPVAEMPKIGVTIYKFDDNFMSFVRRTIEVTAKDKAELMMNDSQNDQGKQNEQVDIMISKGVKSLAINLVDPQAASTIIEKAKNADIPVVFFNKEPSADDLNSYDKAWYVGTISAESGIIQGEVIAEKWLENPEWDKNGDGIMQYVLLKGEPGHPDAEARTKHSVETIVEKGIKVEELELQTGMWDSTRGKDLMDTWVNKHDNKIEVVIANNDGMALGAIESLKANGFYEDDKKIAVFGVDAIPDALQKIEEGYMAGTVLNDATNQGAATFDLAYNLAMGKEPLDGTSWTFDGKAVRVPYVAVTIDNIDFGKDAYKE